MFHMGKVYDRGSEFFYLVLQKEFSEGVFTGNKLRYMYIKFHSS